MLNTSGRWKKLGRILKADPAREWMATYTGPSFALPCGDPAGLDVYVTGRDTLNRSRIGVMRLNPERPHEAGPITEAPMFDLGVKGAFDENGVSYPWIVPVGDALYMYYVGWMPTVLTPFQNHVGLAIKQGDAPWRRYSRAPILERTNAEFLSIGSTAVLRERHRWRMYYTCFREWGAAATDHKHLYVIKYAESDDGIHWRRPDVVCIDAADRSEYAIGRPSVYHDGRVYHMWYSVRGAEYRIGYAWSADGVAWTRRDDLVGLDVGPEDWDARAVCYAHVFEWSGRLYMLYCGNHYGRDGLGLARWEQ